MTPTHTSRVDVPSKIPQTSYDDRFCITRKTSLLIITYWKLGILHLSRWIKKRSFFYSVHKAAHPLTSCYLGLYPNFDEAADDGERVTDDEQNIPAVDELHPVSPAHAAAQFVFEKLHVLLGKEMGDDQWGFKCDTHNRKTGRPWKAFNYFSLPAWLLSLWNYMCWIYGIRGQQCLYCRM